MMFNIDAINFDKMGGLVPVCVQDAETLTVLMIGFMNKEALITTLDTQQVTFYSRTKKRLWTKGETSGHFLNVVNIALDCDNDSLLILAKPQGSTCHLGRVSCFSLDNQPLSLGYCLANLMQTLESRRNCPDSYTQQLLGQGVKRIAQKVGEEGVEVALAAVAGDSKEIVNEIVDLFYHILVLLIATNVPLTEITTIIQQRRRN